MSVFCITPHVSSDTPLSMKQPVPLLHWCIDRYFAGNSRRLVATMSYIQPTKSLLDLSMDLPNLNKMKNYVLSLRENLWNAPENVFIPTEV